MKIDKLTEDQLNLLKNTNLTAEDLKQHIDCSEITIYRWRKALGVSPGRGSKKGKPRPWQEKPLDKRSCPICGSTFEIKLSSSKKYCSRSCGGKSIDKSYMQTEEYKNSLRKETTPAYTKYAQAVHRLSHKIYNKNIDIINPNGYKRTICGVEDGWQLDHIIPINECYKLGMSIEEASDVSNLRMLPWKTNLMRNYVHTV